MEVQLNAIAEKNFYELDDNEVDLVSGGHPGWVLAAAGYGAAAAIFTAGYTIGTSLGKSLYYMTN